MTDRARILVTGSRTWTDEATVRAELKVWRDRYPAPILVHGAARDQSPGATHCADLAERAGIPVRRFRQDTP